MNIDDSFELFKTYMDKFSTYSEVDLSESDTRSKIIDSIFIDVLGWDEDFIKREGYVGKGYFDYKFKIPGFAFVVEAKRNLAEIILPDRHKGAKLNVIERSNKDLVTQIRDYVFRANVAFGIMTNGHQFVVGKFINSNDIDWLENYAAIFNGFDDIRNRYIEFYNLLAYENVMNNCGILLPKNESESFSKRVIDSITHRDSELVRNQFSHDLSSAISRYFGEFPPDNESLNAELLEKCFVENKEIRKNRGEIERFFADLPPQLGNVLPPRNTQSVVEQIKTEVASYPRSKDIEAPPPIIVIGSKGAGKTTFINYLFTTKFGDAKTRDFPNVYIDVRKYAGQDRYERESSIIHDILESVRTKYEALELWSLTALKSIYHKEIVTNDSGIWALIKSSNPDRYSEKLSDFLQVQTENKRFHLYKLSEYLVRIRRLRLCVIIDNADQLDESTQRDLFLFAQSLHKSSKILIFLSLREGYYYKMRLRPPFDAFPSNVYHITAPSYGEVLAKRIDFALEKVELSGRVRGESHSGFVMEIDYDSVKNFLLSVKKSLFGRTNSEILQFIEGTTYPNIREGLEVFKSFLISGYTEAEKYILRQHSTPDSEIPIPIWEFVKTIALNNRKYFSDDQSIVINLFNPVDDSRFLFIKIKILHHFSTILRQGGQSNRFVKYSDAIAAFSDKGYPPTIVAAEFKRLIETKMLETEDHVTDTEDSDPDLSSKNLTITRKGDYYFETLLNSLAYIELCLQTTPIFTEDSYRNLTHAFPYVDDSGKRILHIRLKCAEFFLKYLEAEEIKESTATDSDDTWIVDRMWKRGIHLDFNRVDRILSTYPPH